MSKKYNADLTDLLYVKTISYIANEKVNVNKTALAFNKILSLLMRPNYKWKNKVGIQILFLGLMGNNQTSFKSVIDNLPENIYYNIRDNDDYPLNAYLLYSLFFFPRIVFKLLKSNDADRKIILKSPMECLFAYGKLMMAYRILQKFRPNLLVMSNDHSCLNRCMLFASKKMGIKTLYMQHAAVSTEFPVLQFDYSFLDGEESFDKYRRYSKSNSIVVMSGPSRLDDSVIRHTSARCKIGISVNEFDDFNIITNLCSSLKGIFVGQYKIVVRPHPSMGNWHYNWFVNNGILFSNPALMPLSEYFSDMKVHISNASSIHLDSILYGVPSIQYDLSSTRLNDLFGFVENKLIPKARSQDELFKLLTLFLNGSVDIFPHKEYVKYYIASYKSVWEGKVGCLIAHSIDLILNKKEACLQSFFDDNDIKYYKF